MAAAFFAGLEKLGERPRVVFVGFQLDRVDRRGAKEPAQFLARLALALAKRVESPLIAGIHLDDFASLGVFQDKKTKGGQFQFEAIDDLDGDDVMAPIRLAEGGEG